MRRSDSLLLRGLAWILVAALAALPASAVARSAGLSGWWRGVLEHQGEAVDFYLHLEDGERPAASFSVPRVRMIDGAMGPYRVEGGRLLFPGVGWSLSIDQEGQSLAGVMPAALVPHPSLPIRLVRSEAPAPFPEITPAGPPPEPVWRVSVGSPVWAGLVTDPRRGRLFVAADDGHLNALSTRDGRLIWTVDLGAPVRATPTASGDRLYVATDAALVSLDPGSGTVRWRSPFGPALGQRLSIGDQTSQWDHYSGSPAIAGRMVIAPGRDGCVHAFRRSDGAKQWSQCLGTPVTASPAVAGGKVYVGAFDGNAYALSLRDGAIVWRQDTHGPIPRDAVLAGTNVLFGSRSYDLLALDRDSGRPAWSNYFWFSWVDSPPVVDGGTLYIGSSDLLAVQALDAASGRRIWSTAVPGWSWARPALGRQDIYAGIVGSSGYFQPRAPGLAAIDRRDGTLRWLFRPDGASPDGLAGFASSPVLAGGRVFAADLAGNVYAFEDRSIR
jgi:outer membrane protein assembly factor BamB